jgi:trigger factor
MPEATCKRELELEVPAEQIEKAMERIAKEFARVARIPGFRPGKAPVTLIRRRFADDIKAEVLQSVVPDRLEQALTEQKLVPVTQPHVDKVDFAEAGALKFRASFEVLPEFELEPYQGLQVEIPALDVTEKHVEETLEEMRERAATFVPVEDRAAAKGDFVQMKLTGVPQGGAGEPIQAESVLCHLGAEETIEAFNENLTGTKAGDHKRFEVKYPDDYPDPKLAGQSYTYAVEVTAIKEKRKPELNDEFAKDVNAESLADLREKVKKDLEAVRDRRQKEVGQEKLIETLVSAYDFPVPEALVEHQMDARVERTVRALAAQGVDPRAVNVDWAALRRRHRDRAVTDVRAELILDRIATAENIDVGDEELDREVQHLASHTGEAPAAVRARLTKQGALDRMKSKLRSDKTIDWLYQNSQIRATAEPKQTK